METTKIRIFKGFWTVKDVKTNPNSLFVFGDNDVKRGKGGQAIIRDLANVIGIPTKKFPTNESRAFYTDVELEMNKIKITKAIREIMEASENYEFVVLPENGFGTGLAKLKIKAPKTCKFLETQVEILRKRI